MEKRPDWTAYFLDFARVASTRSTCFRQKVGAVIVFDKVIQSTGQQSIYTTTKL